MRDAVSVELPMRLEALLDSCPEPWIPSLRSVAESAATAVLALGELDLIGYDNQPVDASADLGLWEEMAPVVGSTLAAVNQLAADIEVRFPAAIPPSTMLHRAVKEEMLVAVKDLRAEIAQFGMQVRDPSVVGDRWNLIGELQSFRFRMRDRIGRLVYDSVIHLGDCRRAEVDPAYTEELQQALKVRVAVTWLRRTLKARLQSVGEAEPEDIDWNAQQLERELKEFGSGPGWALIRASDKRTVLEFRSKLQAIRKPGLKKKELGVLIAPFTEFVAGMRNINQRDILVQHDREMMAACGVTIERALTSAGDEGVRYFKQALGQAKRMTGRNGELDRWVEQMEGAELGPDSIQAAGEQLLGLLAGLDLS